MQTIIIAAAPISKDRFAPVYASFPISDRKLLQCMGSQRATDEIIEAGCKFLGVSDSSAYVTGIYYRLPERKSKSFEDFLYDLSVRYRGERRRMFEQSMNSDHGKSIFRVLMQV